MTNHAVVAMVGDDVKQTRCATCETEHEYKHAKVPRQRRKVDAPAALYAQVLASGPKRVAHEGAHATASDDSHRDAPADDAEDAEVTEVTEAADVTEVAEAARPVAAAEALADTAADRKSETDADASDEEDGDREDEEGPVHRPLIRASLPKHEGQAPSRPIPEFTIRQPGGGRPIASGRAGRRRRRWTVRRRWQSRQRQHARRSARRRRHALERRPSASRRRRWQPAPRSAAPGPSGRPQTFQVVSRPHHG